jgi:Ser/Thr protein kinase RdoA (MazF antagonist)
MKDTIDPEPRIAQALATWDTGPDRQVIAIRGAAIARLHVALASFPTEGLESRTWRTVFPGVVYDQCLPPIRQCVMRLERSELDAILKAIGPQLRATTRGLPEQLIHRDCHHGNIVVQHALQRAGIELHLSNPHRAECGARLV